jgi:hypothetical protein
VFLNIRANPHFTKFRSPKAEFSGILPYAALPHSSTTTSPEEVPRATVWKPRNVGAVLSDDGAPGRHAQAPP